MDNQQLQPVQNQSVWIVILPTIIITALIVGGGVWWWQKSSFEKEREELQRQIEELKKQGVIDTSDWEMYRNEEYGFEVKYPISQWTYEEIKEGIDYVNEPETVAYTVFWHNLEAYSTKGFSVRIKKMMLDEEIQSFKQWLNKEYNFEENNILIDNIPGRKFLYKGITRDIHGIKIFFSKDDYIYVISGPDNDMFNQIISTFKFTN